MKQEIILFENEEKKTKNLIAGILRQIANKIEHGSLTLKWGKESLVIHFPEDMTLEVKVNEKQKRKSERSFAFDLIVGGYDHDSMAIGSLVDNFTHTLIPKNQFNQQKV